MSDKNRVLFVDDDSHVRKFYSAIFSQAGFETAVCTNLTTLQQKLANHSFDAVFLDLNLGEEHGLDGIPYVNDLAPSSKIFVLSSQKASEMKEECIDKGVHWYFTKGYDPRKIISKVKEILAESA